MAIQMAEALRAELSSAQSARVQPSSGQLSGICRWAMMGTGPLSLNYVGVAVSKLLSMNWCVVVKKTQQEASVACEEKLDCQD